MSAGARELYFGLLASVEGIGGKLELVSAFLRAGLSRALHGRGALHVRRPVVLAHGGIRWFVPPWDNSFASSAPGERSSPVVPALLRLLAMRPQHVCIDVGANLGFVCMTLAHRFPERRFVAVEPIPWLAEALRRTALLNGYEHVTVVDRAVAGVPVLELEVPRQAGVWFTTLSSSASGASSDAAAMPREIVSVAAVELDRLIADLGVAPGEVACLKIDVEGAEALALATGPRLLAAHPPIVFEALTVEHRAGVEALLCGHGYATFRPIDSTNFIAT